MSGSMNPLAQLFMGAREAEEFEREELANHASQFKAWAKEGSTIALITEKGRFMIDASRVKDGEGAYKWKPSKSSRPFGGFLPDGAGTGPSGCGRDTK